MPGSGTLHQSPEGDPHCFYEFVFANRTDVSYENAPEFTVHVPPGAEVVATVQQVDLRLNMRTPTDGICPVPLSMTVYESMNGDQYYSSQIVAKSAFIPVRDAMVAFKAITNCQFKIAVEFPDSSSVVHRMLFRCYCSKPSCQVSPEISRQSHKLCSPQGPAKAVKWSLVGLRNQGEVEPFDREHDSLRQPEFDNAQGLTDLARECTVM